MTTLSHRRRSAVRVTWAAVLAVVGSAAVFTVPAAVPAPVPAAPAPAVPDPAPAAVPAPARDASPATAGSSAGKGGLARSLPTQALSRLPALRRDPIRDDQWQLRELDAEAAWKVAKGRGAIVAVIDSGVDASHPDLAGQVLPGLDLVSRSGDGRTDPVGHGTTVAALIAGRDDDDRGAVGLAPQARILPIRVLDKDNEYRDWLTLAYAVRWAVDHGADVINLSLGGEYESPALAAALDYAFVRDVVVVACTGNRREGGDPAGVWYPAREPGVVAVAGLDRDTDKLWSGSVTGAPTALTAPATGVVGAKPGGYWMVQGTSFAAPLVAATAALLRSRWTGMSAAEVVNRLISTADDLGPAGRDDRFGFGRIDPVAALTATVAPVSSNPLDDGAAPGVTGFGRAPAVNAAEATPAGSAGHSRSNPAAAPEMRWAGRPAGAPAGPAPAGRWDEAALLLVVLTVGGVLVWRLRRKPAAGVPGTGRGAGPNQRR